MCTYNSLELQFSFYYKFQPPTVEDFAVLLRRRLVAAFHDLSIRAAVVSISGSFSGAAPPVVDLAARVMRALTASDTLACFCALLTSATEAARGAQNSRDARVRAGTLASALGLLAECVSILSALSNTIQATPAGQLADVEAELNNSPFLEHVSVLVQQLSHFQEARPRLATQMLQFGRALGVLYEAATRVPSRKFEHRKQHLQRGHQDQQGQQQQSAIPAHRSSWLGLSPKPCMNYLLCSNVVLLCTALDGKRQSYGLPPLLGEATPPHSAAVAAAWSWAPASGTAASVLPLFGPDGKPSRHVSCWGTPPACQNQATASEHVQGGLEAGKEQPAETTALALTQIARSSKRDRNRKKGGSPAHTTCQIHQDTQAVGDPNDSDPKGRCAKLHSNKGDPRPLEPLAHTEIRLSAGAQQACPPGTPPPPQSHSQHSGSGEPPEAEKPPEVLSAQLALAALAVWNAHASSHPAVAGDLAAEPAGSAQLFGFSALRATASQLAAINGGGAVSGGGSGAGDAVFLQEPKGPADIRAKLLAPSLEVARALGEQGKCHKDVWRDLAAMRMQISESRIRLVEMRFGAASPPKPPYGYKLDKMEASLDRAWENLAAREPEIEKSVADWEKQRALIQSVLWMYVPPFAYKPTHALCMRLCRAALASWRAGCRPADLSHSQGPVATLAAAATAIPAPPQAPVSEPQGAAATGAIASGQRQDVGSVGTVPSPDAPGQPSSLPRAPLADTTITAAATGDAAPAEAAAAAAGQQPPPLTPPQAVLSAAEAPLVVASSLRCARAVLRIALWVHEAYHRTKPYAQQGLPRQVHEPAEGSAAALAGPAGSAAGAGDPSHLGDGRGPSRTPPPPPLGTMRRLREWWGLLLQAAELVVEGAARGEALRRVTSAAAGHPGCAAGMRSGGFVEGAGVAAAQEVVGMVTSSLLDINCGDGDASGADGGSAGGGGGGGASGAGGGGAASGCGGGGAASGLPAHIWPLHDQHRHTHTTFPCAPALTGRRHVRMQLYSLALCRPSALLSLSCHLPFPPPHRLPAGCAVATAEARPAADRCRGGVEDGTWEAPAAATVAVAGQSPDGVNPRPAEHCSLPCSPSLDVAAALSANWLRAVRRMLLTVVVAEPPLPQMPRLDTEVFVAAGTDAAAAAHIGGDAARAAAPGAGPTPAAAAGACPAAASNSVSLWRMLPLTQKWADVAACGSDGGSGGNGSGVVPRQRAWSQTWTQVMAYATDPRDVTELVEVVRMLLLRSMGGLSAATSDVAAAAAAAVPLLDCCGGGVAGANGSCGNGNGNGNGSTDVSELSSCCNRSREEPPEACREGGVSTTQGRKQSGRRGGEGGGGRAGGARRQQTWEEQRLAAAVAVASRLVGPTLHWRAHLVAAEGRGPEAGSRSDGDETSRMAREEQAEAEEGQEARTRVSSLQGGIGGRAGDGHRLQPRSFLQQQQPWQQHQQQQGHGHELGQRQGPNAVNTNAVCGESCRTEETYCGGNSINMPAESGVMTTNRGSACTSADVTGGAVGIRTDAADANVHLTSCPGVPTTEDGPGAHNVVPAVPVPTAAAKPHPRRVAQVQLFEAVSHILRELLPVFLQAVRLLPYDDDGDVTAGRAMVMPAAATAAAGSEGGDWHRGDAELGRGCSAGSSGSLMRAAVAVEERCRGEGGDSASELAEAEATVPSVGWAPDELFFTAATTAVGWLRYIPPDVGESWNAAATTAAVAAAAPQPVSAAAATTARAPAGTVAHAAASASPAPVTNASTYTTDTVAAVHVHEGEGAPAACAELLRSMDSSGTPVRQHEGSSRKPSLPNLPFGSPHASGREGVRHLQAMKADLLSLLGLLIRRLSLRHMSRVSEQAHVGGGVYEDRASVIGREQGPGVGAGVGRLPGAKREGASQGAEMEVDAEPKSLADTTAESGAVEAEATPKAEAEARMGVVLDAAEGRKRGCEEEVQGLQGLEQSQAAVEAAAPATNTKAKRENPLQEHRHGTPAASASEGTGSSAAANVQQSLPVAVRAPPWELYAAAQVQWVLMNLTRALTYETREAFRARPAVQPDRKEVQATSFPEHRTRSAATAASTPPLLEYGAVEVLLGPSGLLPSPRLLAVLTRLVTEGRPASEDDLREMRAEIVGACEAVGLRSCSGSPCSNVLC
ncbi:hypothetical protein VOLCADRAFT_98939 [Volvox carteri f. nagariensis]|uniref:Uncharacterized protein n=1 Tax=Volvox carteri f. nagariensis TaxID=3068 RepID=D8UGN5_VOLCA|nr:uncharacterized protein VOLCADRAFT_98939 [Volvox carteri f. nagariensis]EFJ41151.1 hypothetical protein VOLCADRAFT_98939 [Volvox carteri f. nagariensis]|eukprot:XP_002957823.1 hypothetical protein VOLCADRAFT_98939 [Volvox carteri f. nagariensis]